MKSKLAGVLGGVGPMATVYFQQMVLELTEASCDQDHLDMLVSNHATIPDRTAFILGESRLSPRFDMAQDAQMLARAGCDFLVLPCNTAHFFYEHIQNAVSIPLLNIIEGTVSACAEQANTYDIMCRRFGLSCIYPDAATQKQVTAVIYDGVKAGRHIRAKEMAALYNRMREEGCDAIVLGCTELSVAHRDLELHAAHPDVIDSLETLARRTIEYAGKRLRS